MKNLIRKRKKHPVKSSGFATPLKRGRVTKLFLFVLLVTPLISNAQQLVPCDGIDCGYDDLVSLIGNVVEFLVAIGAAVVAIMFAYAGFLYLTDGGNGNKVSQAKKMFQNAAWGFIIVLAAFLIVETVLVTLGVKEVFYDKFIEF